MAKHEPSKADIARTLAMSASFTEALQGAIKDPYVTVSQQLLLVQLYVHGEVLQGDLEKYTLVAKSSNSRMVAKLGQGENPTKEAGPGWVESYEDLTNRRTKIVRLTTKGRTLLERAAKDAARLLQLPPT
jgi:DNA-binding MarR family transcriptional regulator